MIGRLSKDTRVRRFVVRACRLRFPFHGENHTAHAERERKIRGAVPAKSPATFHITRTRAYTHRLLRQFPCREFFSLSLLDESQLSLFSLLFPGNKEAIFEKMVFEDDRSTSYHYERVYDDSLITDNFRGKKSRSNYVNPVNQKVSIYKYIHRIITTRNIPFLFFYHCTSEETGLQIAQSWFKEHRKQKKGGGRKRKRSRRRRRGGVGGAALGGGNGG